MSIVDFNDCIIEYDDTVRYLKFSSRKGGKRSAEIDWSTLESICEEDIRTTTYDSLPKDYKTHIDGQCEIDFRDMDKIEFLEAILSFETINKGRRALREKDKKKDSSKKYNYRKRGTDTEYTSFISDCFCMDSMP